MTGRKLYAGIDIGIKNMAVCIIDTELWDKFWAGGATDPGIVYWDNLNFVDEAETCVGKTAKDAVCGKRAKWVCKTGHYCGVHKRGVLKLSECERGKIKSYSAPKIDNLDMRALKKKAFQELDKLDILREVTSIAIESQPRINQKMKMFAAAIEAYFLIRLQIDAASADTNRKAALKRIKYSPAKNKLKLYKGPFISTTHIKNSYDKRKYLAKRQTEYFLEECNGVLDRWYTPHTKKDDLADSFLHCVLSIKGLSPSPQYYRWA